MSTPLTRDDLSEHDKNVLDSIFNPFQIGGSENILNFDELLPEEVQDPIEEKTPEILKSIDLELKAVNFAEEENYNKALELFQESINVAPQRSSVWNNRAQTHRLLGNDEAALFDLEEALKLSKKSGRTGCRAFCQRGLLKRKNEDDVGAREDFNEAAKLGSQFARKQLVELNPYAALCNQMLRDTFGKLS